MRFAIGVCAALLGFQVTVWAADGRQPVAKGSKGGDVQRSTDKPSADAVRAMEELLAGVPQPASKPLPEVKGVVSWKTLAQVSVVRQKDRFVPEFAKDVAALDKKEVRLQGFMMPLDVGEKQKRFLLTAMPSSCAFCLPGGPEQMVEVQARNPVKQGFEPVVLAGKLTVLRDDPAGLLYRLTDAVAVER